MGQPFDLSLKLSALNGAGAITRNYRGEHANATLSFVAENGNGALTDRLAITPTAAWVDGEYT